MSKPWTSELFSGASFPDLSKALGAKGIEDLLKKIKPGDSIYKAANAEKAKLEKQYRGDFVAAVQSHGVAVTAGNANSCLDKKQFAEAATKQQKYASANTKRVKLPSYGRRRVTPRQMPRNRGVAPVANAQGGQPRHPSLRNTQFAANPRTPAQYKLESVTPQALDGGDNFRRYVASQAGFRGKAIDRSISITHDGTPMYGDDQLNRANQDQVSANLANTPPTLDFPSKVSPGATVDAGKIQRKQAGQQQNAGDTVGNIIKLGAIGAAVTAILFLIRDILGVVSFIINISTLTSTVTNIAQTFLAVFDNIAALMGLGEGLSKPISDTFDGILNNVFGKDKVEYVKYNFARINTAFTAAGNLLNRTRSMSANLAAGIEANAQNTSRIGNWLRRCGVVDEKMAVMDEKIQVRVDASSAKLLNDKLGKVQNVSSDLQGVAGDLKTAKDELKQIDTDKAEREKEAKEKTSEAAKTDEAAKGKSVEIPTLSQGGT